MDSPSFGAELRRLRTSAGLSLDELARRAGYTKGHVSRIENGQKSPSEQFARLCDTVLGAQGFLIERAVSGPQLCPYPGLTSFSPEDARWYFGRDRVVAELVTLLGDPRPAVVLGPSGAGKSSLLRAGLTEAVLAGALPTSQPGRPAVLYATPTTWPSEPPRPLSTYSLVIVDQFEELFTLVAEKDRAEFVERLCELPVVLGLRADFYGHCLAHPRLVEALRTRAFPLAPMTNDQLREAITAPAEDVGLTVEPGLVELLLRDLDGAALPLLAHALRATWQQRCNGVLTVAGYQRTGGIHGAVAATAERVYNGLTSQQQQQARHVLLSLVRVGDGEDHTRRPAPLEELTDATEVVEAFTRARLVTVSATHVELSHEGVLRAWPRLQSWIAEDRDLLRVRQQLTATAREWQNGRDPHLLYQGARLVAARELSSLGPAEQEFVTTSVARQHRRAWRLRALTAVLAVVTLLVTGVAVFAFQQQAVAQRESEQARSGQLAAAAAAARSQGHVETANLLAAEAFRLGRDVPERRSDLLSAQNDLLAARMPRTLSGTSPRYGQSAAPDGTVLTFDAARRIQLWRDRKLHREFYTGPEPIRSAVTDGTLVAAAKGAQIWFSDGRTLTFPDRVQGIALHGQTLAVGDVKGAVRLVDIATGHTREINAHGAPIAAVAFDGRMVATARGDGTVQVVGVDGTRREFRVDKGENVLALAIAPDGSKLVAAGHNRLVWSWDLATGHGRLLTNGKVAGSALTSVAFSPDSKVFAVAGDDFRTDVYGTNMLFKLGGHTAPVRGVSFIDGGHTLVTSSEDGTTALWDLRRGAVVGGEGQQHRSVAIVENGVVTAGTEPHPLLWNPATREVIGRFEGHSYRPHHVVATEDGRLLASLSNDLSLRLWNPHTRKELRKFTIDAQSCGLAISRTGRYLAAGDARGNVWIWRDNELFRKFKATAGAAPCALAFDHDEKRLAFGTDDRRVQSVDLQADAQPAELGSHNDSVRNLAFGAGTFASISHDTNVKLWSERTTLRGLTGITNAIAFNEDASILAASGDGAIRLWRKEDRAYRWFATLSGHQQLVDTITFRGNTLVSISNDGTLRMWDLDEERVRQDVCARYFDIGRVRWSRYVPGVPAPSAC